MNTNSRGIVTGPLLVERLLDLEGLAADHMRRG